MRSRSRRTVRAVIATMALAVWAPGVAQGDVGPGYRSTVLSQNPTAFYPIDVTTTGPLIPDLSANHYDATLSGAAMVAINSPLSGSANSPDGVASLFAGGAIEFPLAAAQRWETERSMSYTFWVRPVVQPGNPTLFTVDGVDGDYGVWLQPQPGNAFKVATTICDADVSGGTPITHLTATTVPAGAWFQFTLLYETLVRTSYLFVNGVFDGPTTPLPANLGTPQLSGINGSFAGRHGAGSCIGDTNFLGDLDGFAAWERMLNFDTEAPALYAARDDDVPPPTPTPPDSIPAPSSPAYTNTNPPPVQGVNATIGTVTGTVIVRTPDGRTVTLRPGDPVPNGAHVDARRGTVQLFAALDRKGTTYSGEFSGGQFVFRQPRGSARADIVLDRPASCPRAALARPATRSRPDGGSARNSVRARERRVGSGGFRTIGGYSSGAAIGTAWTTTEACTSTTTSVTQGAVQVRDLVTRRTVTVRTGRSYVARARAKRAR